MTQTSLTRTLRGVLVSVQTADQPLDASTVAVEIDPAGELAGPLGARLIGQSTSLPRPDATPLSIGQIVAGQGALALVVPRWQNGYFGEQVALERALEQLYTQAAGSPSLAVAQPGAGGGFDLEPAALIALNTLVRFAETRPDALQRVVFVTEDDAARARFEERLVEVALTMIGTPTEHPTA